jgi:hypothetical protein
MLRSQLAAIIARSAKKHSLNFIILVVLDVGFLKFNTFPSSCTLNYDRHSRTVRLQ